jgi:hypothetical protein
MNRCFKLFVFITALFCVSVSSNAAGLREEYQAILNSSCTAEENGVTDERELIWDCPKEKTGKLDDFRLRLEALLTRIMKSHPSDMGGDLKRLNKFNSAWEAYRDAASSFDYDFHSPGSMGTSGQIKSNQVMIKQRIELLLIYLLDFYEFKGIE